jgi:hypothetical protein
MKSKRAEVCGPSGRAPAGNHTPPIKEGRNRYCHFNILSKLDPMWITYFSR